MRCVWMMGVVPVAVAVAVTIAIAVVTALVAINGKRDELLLWLGGDILALNNHHLCRMRAPQRKHQGSKDCEGGRSPHVW